MPPPATTTIEGSIVNASGVGVANVQVLLSPLSPDVGSPVARVGFGVMLEPVEVLTDEDGAFSVDALQGFQYRLQIDAIGLDEVFTAPEVATIRFDLLGLVPSVGQAKNWVDSDGVPHVEVTIITPRVDTVLTRWDTLIVERAAEKSGPWTEVEVRDLVAGTDTYVIDDGSEDALPNGYYRAVYEDTGSGDRSSYSDPAQGSSFEDALVLSVSDLKQIYLFSLDLTGDDGTPYPTLMFERYIRAATRWMEHELGIPIVARNIVGEVHDHFAHEYGRWGWFNLHNRPVSRIDRVMFQYPSMTAPVDISLEWVVREDNGFSGLVQIVPGRGNIADVLMIPGSLMPLWSGAGGRVPGIWHFDYRAGWEAGEIPEDIQHVIGMMASLGVMNVAGDLVGGSGLQGWSVSIPGLSQNVTTTNSSTNAGFGARVLEYMKEIKMILPAIKRAYGSSVRMSVA